MAKPAPILVVGAVVTGVASLFSLLFANDSDGIFTIPILSMFLAGLAAMCVIGVVVLAGIADLLNQHGDLIDRSMRELRERQP